MPLQQAAFQLSAGARLGDVINQLRTDFGPDSARLFGALSSSARLGTEVLPSLQIGAAEMRLARRRRAEVRARRIPVRLLLPLVVCILPAFALLTVVPLLLSSIADLSR